MYVPEPRFNLAKPSSTKETLICMQVKYCGERFFISTGEKVLPADWDFQRQRVHVTRKNLSASTTNMFLDRMVAIFKNVFRDLLVTYDLPKATLVTEKVLEIVDAPFNAAKNKEQPKAIRTFYKFIENYIEECKGIKTVATVKTYTSTFNHLKLFAQLKNKDEFKFEEITIEWRNGFISFYKIMEPLLILLQSILKT